MIFNPEYDHAAAFHHSPDANAVFCSVEQVGGHAVFGAHSTINAAQVLLRWKGENNMLSFNCAARIRPATYYCGRLRAFT